ARLSRSVGCLDTAPTSPVGSSIRPRSTLSGTSDRSLLEVDAHHGAAECWATDFCEPGGSEDADVPDVQLTPGNVLAALRDHWIALQRTGSAFAHEVHGEARQRIADAAATEPRARDKARHSPDARVGSIIRSLPPRHAAEKRIGGSRFHVAPPGGLTAHVGDKAARGGRPRMFAIGLLAQHVGPFPVVARPRVPPQLEALALATPPVT